MTIKRKTIEKIIDLNVMRIPLEKFIFDMQQIQSREESLGFTKFEIEQRDWYDSQELRIIASREETDEEYEKRTKRKANATEMEKFLKRISKYKVGWDGYDGQLPEEKQIELAKVFFSKLPVHLKPKLTISLAGDAEINFYFFDKQHGLKLDFGISKDCVASYFCYTPDLGRFVSDDFNVFEELPLEILSRITA